MIYPSIDKILTIVDSKYNLVHIAATRSRDMQKTNHYQMPDAEYICKKNLGRALEEIEKGLIKF